MIQAKTKQAGVFLEDLCFHAQLAVEKAIKALLLEKKGSTHDLTALIFDLSQHIKIPPELQGAKWLTGYSVAGRYPNAGDPVSEEEYLKAVNDAETALNWIERHLHN